MIAVQRYYIDPAELTNEENPDVVAEFMASSPRVSVIVPVTLKVILSLSEVAFASRIACRKLPGPLSLVFVTVMVAAWALKHVTANRKKCGSRN